MSNNKYTLINTEVATHAELFGTRIQFISITDNGKAWLDGGNWQDIHDDYEVSLPHMELSRPHNETQAHWTTNGVTQYAQGNKMNKVNENTNQAKLWEIIDDIDTFSDQIKPTDLEGHQRYYEAVTDMVGKRFQILESDGYDLFELGTMPKNCNKTVAPSGEGPVNTDEMFPISYVKKFTPLVVGDGYVNSIGETGTLNEADCKILNVSENIFLFITSFADRPNTTGKQPVGGFVDCNWCDGDVFIGRRANSFSWGLSEHASNVITWKPNHATMLKQYQAEQLAEEAKRMDNITMNGNDGDHYKEINAATALYAFAGWLTSMKEPITFSEKHWATPAAEMVGAFINLNNLGDDIDFDSVKTPNDSVIPKALTNESEDDEMSTVETPVFTKAQADDGKKPAVGSECMVSGWESGDWEGKIVKVYSHDVNSNDNVVLAGAEICSGGVTAIEFHVKYLKPIQKDESKLFNFIYDAVFDDDISDDLNQQLVVELMNHEDFTITLKSE